MRRKRSANADHPQPPARPAVPDSGEPEPHVGFRRPREWAAGNYVPKKLKGLEGAALWRAIRFDREERTLAKLPLGASRLGGVPDLPPDLAWPTYGPKRKQRPMPLLAQINLAALKGRCPALPDAGWLYAFGGFDHGLDARVVLHEGPKKALVRAALPPDPRAAGLFDVYPLTPRPPGEGGADDDGAWLFGEPCPVFGTPAELVALWDRSDDSDDWINLLALTSVGSMEWSDAGHLYLLIRRRDLERRDFSGVVPAVASG